VIIGGVSCTSEEVKVPDPPKQEEKQAQVRVPLTRAVNDGDAENAIVRARLIVVSQTGKVLVNTYLNDAYISGLSATDRQHLQFSELLPVGYVDWYIIANELTSWSLGTYTVNSQITAADIENKVLSFSAYPVVNTYPNPIPMFGMRKSLYVHENGSTTLGGIGVDAGEVVRLYAKVTLNLFCKFSDLDNGGIPIQLDSVTIKRIPTAAWLGRKIYEGTNLTTDFFNGALSTPTTTPTITPDSFRYEYKFYLPEYQARDSGLYTYLSLVVNLASSTDPSTRVEYKVVVGDGIASHDNTYMLGNSKRFYDVFVTRNTHYHYGITIRSFSNSGEKDIYIRPQVVDWDTAIKVDSVEERESTLFLSESDFHPAGTATYYGQVNIVTDYRFGWNAVVEALTGGATCTITSPATLVNQPSGQLKFTYTGGNGSSARIKITTGAGQKVTKWITLSRP
jgi:hypothetical protein